MIRSAVTIALVEQARRGPFVYHGDLSEHAHAARQLGFDAIEVFAPGPDAVDANSLSELLDATGLQLAAVGTGAGAVVHGLTLTDPDETIRTKAIEFIRSMIDFGGPFGAPAIIGSMQGRFGGEVSRDQALDHLAQALQVLGDHAGSHGVPLLYEPLNRYETNLLVQIDESSQFLRDCEIANVKLLADLFHMNIEETNLADAIAAGGDLIGHVHLADSNRQAAGFGHTDFAPIAEALREIGFDGYASAEVFPKPDSTAAATQTIAAFRELFPR